MRLAGIKVSTIARAIRKDGNAAPLARGKHLTRKLPKIK
jgi:hypothetical protein